MPKFVYSIEDIDLVVKTILKWQDDNCGGEVFIVPFFTFAFTDLSEAQSFAQSLTEDYGITSVLTDGKDLYFLVAYPKCSD